MCINKILNIRSILIILIIVTGGIYTNHIILDLIFKRMLPSAIIILSLFTLLYLKKEICDLTIKIFILAILTEIIILYFNDYTAEGLYQLGSILFVTALYAGFKNYNKENWSYLFDFLIKFQLTIILILLILIFNVILNNQIYYDIFLTGFNNNRTNFSVWIAYFTLSLVLYYEMKKRNEVLVIISIIVCSIACLISGGRLGYVINIVLLLYFLYYLCTFSYGIKFIIFTFYALLNTLMYLQLKYVNMMLKSNDILRTSENIKNLTVNNIDIISSSRITLTKSSIDKIKNFDSKEFFIGKGYGNFTENIGGTNYDVHISLLKILGESGFMLFALLLLIMALPLLKIKKIQYLLLYGIAISPSLMQPNLIFLGLNNCIIFWILYVIINNPKINRNISINE